MPMEESGNLLILLDAILSRLNATEEEAVLQRLRNYSNLLGIWASYLKTSLPDPGILPVWMPRTTAAERSISAFVESCVCVCCTGNQLCTDDFEGISSVEHPSFTNKRISSEVNGALSWKRISAPLVSLELAVLSSVKSFCPSFLTGPSPHNSNLAAKGIIGLAAYADIRRRMGALEDYNEFTADAHAFVTQYDRHLSPQSD